MSPADAMPWIAGCVLLQGFFSGSEIAMVSADRVGLAQRAQNGHLGSALAARLLEKEERLLGTCLIGSQLAVVTGTTLVWWTAAASGAPNGWLFALAFVPVALLFGDAIPKALYQGHADTLAPIVALPLVALQLLFRPFLAVVSVWTDLLRAFTGRADEVPVTREEILKLLENPDIPATEQRLIRGVFEIRDTVVEEVMTPLVQVDAIPCDARTDFAADVAHRTGHSRVPVFRDRIDNLVGVVQAHDLLFHSGADITVEALMRPVLYVPETQRVDALLEQMRASRSHFAVVVDEYGGSVGVVTVEDVLEEIVGEIRDERDVETPGIVQLGERTWRVPGQAEVWELDTVIGRELPKGDYETVSGLILARIGRIPKTGEVILVDDIFVLKVEYATDRAVLWVKLTVR